MVKNRVKNKVVYIALALIIALAANLALIFASPNYDAVSASTPVGNIITEADMNSNLYYKLRSIAGGTLRDNSIYSQNITELNLSFTATGAVSDTKKITSLAGLELLDLRTVKVLKVNYQNLTEITPTTLSGMPNLEHLEAVDNNLTELDISYNENIKTLVLDNNKISSFDASNVNTLGYETENSLISLNHNNLSSISAITLPNITANSKLTVNLINNNITDAITTQNLGYTLNLGVQGLRYFGSENTNIVTTTKQIKYYPCSFSEISTKVFKKVNDSYTEVLTFNNSSSINNTYNLAVGDYKLEFYINDTALDDDTKLQYPYCINTQFIVQPPKPTFYFLIDGKKVQTITKLTQPATFVLEGDQNSTMLSSVAGSEWVEGSEISLTQGGKYSVSMKAKIGDYESEIVTIYISANPNLYVSNGILLLLICLLAGVFVGAIYLIKRFVLK